MTKSILAILLLLMPIDAFVPGAALLREFGGRPFNIVLILIVLGSAVVAPKEWIGFKWRREEFFSILAIFGAVAVSTLYFLSVQISTNSVVNMQRSPFYSYISQFLVFLASIMFLMFLRRSFELSRRMVAEALAPICLWVSWFHLIFFLVHGLSINGIDVGALTAFMNWVRPDPGIMRAFGLMSEPSYWGAFVAYVWPVLFFCFPKDAGYRTVARFTAAVLIGAALAVGARTLIGIIFIQALILVAASGVRNTIKMVLLVLCVAVGLVVLTVSTDIFSVADNLSSAMRLGSTLLGVNVASAHGLLGVGVGQFHYYFRPEFAPGFLSLSAEAASIYADVSDSRASTFNFYVRLVVELGVLGLAGYGCLIWMAGRSLVRLHERHLRAGLGLAFVGALSFWLTQDTFLYSPALFFIALGLSLNEIRTAEQKPPSADVSIRPVVMETE